VKGNKNKSFFLHQVLFCPIVTRAQQKIKIFRTNQQSNLRFPANQFSPSAGTTLANQNKGTN